MLLQRFYFLLILFICVQRLHAQPIIPRFENIGVNEGLSQSSVYSIYQDKFGFMWFGTADGLNRFDGTDLKIYKIENTLLNIESSVIRGKLCEDTKGNIWFSNEAGIYYYSRLADNITTVKQFYKQEYGGTAFEGFAITAGKFWMLNTSRGIFSYDLITGSFEKFGHPVFKDLRSHLPFKQTVEEDGSIWFTFFRNDGLYKFSPASKTFEHYFKGEDYSAIGIGHTNNYLLDGNGRLTVCNRQTGKIKRLVLSEGKTVFRASQVFEDKFNRVWAFSDGDGLCYYDLSTQRTYFFHHHNSRQRSLSIDLINTCFIDRNDNLWIGTDGGGVSRLDLKPPKFNLFPLSEGDYPFLKDYFTKCFYEDEKGRIWFGTYNNGFSIYDPLTGDIKNYSKYKGGTITEVGAILKDRDGKMWIGCDNGFLLFDEMTGTFKEVLVRPNTVAPHYGNDVHDLKQLQNGDLIACRDQGLVLFKKERSTYKAVTFEGTLYLNWLCTSACQLSNGDIWVASPNAGLMRLKSTGTLKLEERFLEGINFRSIHADETDKDLLWLSSTKGLIKFNLVTHRYYVYNQKDGMRNSYVYGVLEDAKHNFWMSTNGGLIYFDRKANNFHAFTANEGLQSNEFNTSAFCKGASGTFYFGGIKGFNWFRNIDPAIRSNTYRPAVAITDILVNDVPLQKDETFFHQPTIRLPYDRNNLTVRFAALDFTHPQANKVQYKLQGLEGGWITTQAKSVRYPNLPPGSYVFRIKAGNADGVWSNEQQVNIVITAPFWKRRWFYAVIVLIAIAAVVIITWTIVQRKLSQQLRELEKQRAVEVERHRISKDMHDEIGSGLTQIALLTELMQTQQKAEAELKKDVGTISMSARKLVESISEIVWALNPHNDTLENLLAYLREQTAGFFEPFDIHYTINFPDELPMVRLTNEQRRNLFLVAKEALNNALKHSCAGKISLSMMYTNQTIFFTVKDNGKGFNETKTKVTSNGLKNMERRMKDISGSFTIETNTTGSHIHFSLFAPVCKKTNTTYFTSVTKN